MWFESFLKVLIFAYVFGVIYIFALIVTHKPTRREPIILSEDARSRVVEYTTRGGLPQIVVVPK